MQFYEEEDFERLVEVASQADERALITVLLGGDAGLRLGEMIALEWSDIDFRRSLLHVNRSEWHGHIGTPKGGRARTVNMTSRLAAVLKSHRHLKGPRVLYSDDGSTADRDALASWIRRAERRAGLPLTGRLHVLRHTFCSRLAMRGATMKAVQELAGHQEVKHRVAGGSAWESNSEYLNKRNRATTHANSSFRPSEQQVESMSYLRATAREYPQERPSFGDSLETDLDDDSGGPGFKPGHGSLRANGCP